MSDLEPSNAVLAIKLDDLIASNKTEHTSILTQVVKTNGRVTDLERFKNMVWGGMIITNIIIVPVAVALFIMLIRK